MIPDLFYMLVSIQFVNNHDSFALFQTCCLIPDDHTRVVLHDFEDEHDDYINANYVDVSILYQGQLYS